MSNDFTYRYAIQLPNGNLLMRETGHFGFAKMFGLDTTPVEPTPQTWESRDAADDAVRAIRAEMSRKGIEWLGTVVQQLCTPFTSVDPAEHFASEVQSWLNEQGRS